MNDLVEVLRSKSANDPALRALLKSSGKANFRDTAQYSIRYSHQLGNILSENVLDIPPDVRETAAEELLKYGYDNMNTILAEVQKSLDEQAGIHIRPQKADFPSERVRQFTHSLIDPTVEDSIIKRRARAGSETITKSFHDSFIKKNATFRNDAGLKCYITREGSNCCKWCSEVAGRYEFGSQPSDIFRRHDNCDCTIDYDGQKLRGKLNADGSRSKTWEEVPNADGSYEPKVLSVTDARAAEQRNLSQFRGVKINSSSIDNGRGSGIISGRGSGTGASISNNHHTYEKIGEIDFNDKMAVANSLVEFENKYSNSAIEHCRVICKNGEVYEIHGDRYTVNTEILGDKMNGSINNHNHVTGESQYSFSWEDIDSSVKDGSHITMAYDEKYRYSMTFPEKAIDTDTLREAYDISENEVMLNNYNYQYYSIGNRISDEDYQHEVIKRTCERVGVKYERKLKA